MDKNVIMFDSIDSVEKACENVSHANFKIYPVYPICGEAYADHPAISRRDNKTKICSMCGIKEALSDFENNLKKESNLIGETADLYYNDMVRSE